ncbi:DedA family protein [Planococcus ruber]|uniref:DedA family protein n=1 Tax=Planococcus ruber TaxID=2027871 RepID=UPI001FEF3A6D|nr:VTT domain-containing protein [Planococcus ruber]MCJ1907987.1 VTT domain-containing protein [Planococcus ruber]
MIEGILAFLESLGMKGLFSVMFLEGSSLPFPGVALVIAYGGLLNHDLPATAWLSAGLAASYSLASLIPYFLGNKFQNIFQRKFHKGLKKASDLFRRYGIWSIAISRPFGIGNYISYLAGISKIPLGKYAVLTFIGIYPWCFAMLRIGHYFNGNYEAFTSFMSASPIPIYGYLAAALGAAGIWLYLKAKSQNNKFKA